MSERRDQGHVCRSELSPRLDIHTHLSLIEAFALLDPGQVHYGVNSSVRNLVRPLDVGAIEGREAAGRCRAWIQVLRRVAQILWESGTQRRFAAVRDREWTRRVIPP